MQSSRMVTRFTTHTSESSRRSTTVTAQASCQEELKIYPLPFLPASSSSDRHPRVGFTGQMSIRNSEGASIGQLRDASISQPARVKNLRGYISGSKVACSGADITRKPRKVKKKNLSFKCQEISGNSRSAPRIMLLAHRHMGALGVVFPTSVPKNPFGCRNAIQ